MRLYNYKKFGKWNKVLALFGQTRLTDWHGQSKLDQLTGGGGGSAVSENFHQQLDIDQNFQQRLQHP